MYVGTHVAIRVYYYHPIYYMENEKRRIIIL